MVVGKEIKTVSDCKNNIIAIDIFCGAGGFTLAAKEHGIKVIAAIDNNKHANQTYRNNFITRKRCKPKLYTNDVFEISPQTLLSDLKIKSCDLDILMGGPPCQGFSTHRVKDAGVNDPRNLLLKRYFDFVNTLKPKTFIVENVSGLLWKRHKRHVDMFYRSARNSGYKVFPPVVLNARDFGVPQNRKRVFILGIRDDLNLTIDWPPKPTHFDPESKEVKEQGYLPWVCASAVFQNPSQRDDPNSIHMNHSREMIEVFKSTPKNGGSRAQSKRQLPCHQNHDGHRDVYGRIDPSKPGPTITTGCVNPSKGRFLHPTENHGITLRQAARFQTFPDDFFFQGGLIAIAIQIGNAVPIHLGQKVIKSIYEVL